MPRLSRLTPLQIVGIAASAGIGWGIVMALVAWIRDGAEIVLLQGWIFAAAWLFGRAAGRPRAGALAGLAIVGGAIWTFELLPNWGLESAIRREVVREEDVETVAGQFDRNDIVLFSTMVVGALIGLAGSLHRPRAALPAPVAGLPAPPPAAVEAPAPPPPLWAGFHAPAPPPAEDVAPQPQPQPPAAPGTLATPARTPWASALLLAGLATDFCLGWIPQFDLYTDRQDAVAVGFLAIGLVAAAWLARRYAIYMIVAGMVLAGGFASVQHAEYEQRRHPEIGVIR